MSTYASMLSRPSPRAKVVPAVPAVPAVPDAPVPAAVAVPDAPVPAAVPAAPVPAAVAAPEDDTAGSDIEGGDAGADSDTVAAATAVAGAPQPLAQFGFGGFGGPGGFGFPMPYPGMPHPGMPHPGMPHPGMSHPGMPFGVPPFGIPHFGMPFGVPPGMPLPNFGAMPPPGAPPLPDSLWGQCSDIAGRFHQEIISLVMAAGSAAAAPQQQPQQPPQQPRPIRILRRGEQLGQPAGDNVAALTYTAVNQLTTTLNILVRLAENLAEGREPEEGILEELEYYLNRIPPQSTSACRLSDAVATMLAIGRDALIDFAKKTQPCLMLLIDTEAISTAINLPSSHLIIFEHGRYRVAAAGSPTRAAPRASVRVRAAPPPRAAAVPPPASKEPVIFRSPRAPQRPRGAPAMSVAVRDRVLAALVEAD